MADGVSSWKSLPIRNEIVSVVEGHFGFTSLTEVQTQCIPQFLAHKDVVVQAPTGSGKTMAFVVPILEILLRQEEPLKKWQVGALILVPNRELALQITRTIEPFLETLSSGLTLISFIGGTKSDVDVLNFKKNGGNIVVATPGRLCDLLDQSDERNLNLSGHLKSLEVLVLDEADRLLELGFQESLRDILTRLPKQRRTGLFSATQTEELDELARTGLRNPVFITVFASPASKSIRGTCDDDSMDVSVTPSTLKNYYAIIPVEAKFTAMVHFIRQNWTKKVLIFVSTCACVDYFGDLIRRIFEKKKQHQKDHVEHILILHGKKKKKRRQIFDQFRNRGSGVLICTDVMARGIDIENIDWVVQFEPPRQASWFVHRCGRTARCGKDGNALLLLSPSEQGYVDFLQRNQAVTLTPWTIPYKDGQEWNTLERIRKLSSRSRELLEKGSKAFVSFIQAYSKHDCHIVCSLKELDIVNLAHCFGLLRLPRMPEFRGRDLSGFRKCDFKTADIAYEDKERETLRLSLLEEGRTKTSRRTISTAQDIIPNPDMDSSNQGPDKEQGARLSRRKKKKEIDDQDELDDDYKMVKRLKRGKLSKEQFDEHFLG